jgi:hypothetical protein
LQARRIALALNIERRRLDCFAADCRIVVATAVAALLFAGLGTSGAWYAAQRHLERARADWLGQQADPRRAALLTSDEGKAAVHLAELGVAGLLAKCSGRRPDGRLDGFKLGKEGTRPASIYRRASATIEAAEYA